MSKRFFATADLHFSPSGAWKHRGIKGDAEFSFEQIVDATVAERPSALFLLGDLMEAREVEARSPDLLLFLRAQFQRLVDARVPVRYVLGNHDAGIDWFRLLPGVQCLDGEVLRLPGLESVLYGLNWTPRGKLAARLDAIPAEVNVLLAHQAWKEIIDKGDKYIEPEASFDDLPAHITDVISGDYHKTRAVDIGDLEAVRGYSPGPIALQTIYEDEEKNYFVFHEEEGIIVAERRFLKTRTVIRLRVESEEDLAEALRLPRQLEEAPHPSELKKPESLRKPIVEVTYFTDVPDAQARLAAAFEDRVHYFPKPRERAREERVVSAAARREVVSRGLAGVAAMLTNDRPAVRGACLRLLDTEDPAETLAAMKEEMLAA